MKTTTIRMSRQKNDATTKLQRIFGDTKVEEGKTRMTIFATAEDIAMATRKDPGHCVLAKACQRYFGPSTKVMFNHTTAYVQVPTKDGTVVKRFRTGPAARRLIENFDSGQKINPGEIVLEPFPASGTLDVRRKREKQYRAEVNSGKRKPRKLPQVSSKNRAFEFEVRNGTGSVHFSKGINA